MAGLLHVVVVVAAILAGCLPSLSAEIRVLDLKAPLLGDESDMRKERQCHIRLEGLLEKGDLEKLKQAMPDDYRGYILCLDSSGGSFAEALRFIQYFQERPFGTWVEEERRCESACALVFMAGSEFAFEAGEYPWRRMHPKAKLGFHSPDLVVSDGAYDAAAVNRAYKIALQTISEAVGLLQAKRDFDGLLWFKPSLLLTLLSTPPDTMHYVETLDEAGLWGIEVFPGPKAPPVSEAALSTGCRNALSWTIDQRVGDNRDGEFSIDQSGGKWVLDTVGMNPSRCSFELNNGQQSLSATVRVDTIGGDDGGGGYYRLYPTAFLKADTLLASLPIEPDASSALPSGMVCLVIKDGAVADREPCRKEVRNDAKVGEVFDFVWPSGSKTVVRIRPATLEINGAPGSYVNAPAGETAQCAVNRKTNNVFCVSPSF